MDEQQIIDGLKPVCQCQGIARKRLLDLMATGYRTVEALQQATGAGRGSCHGKRCLPRIADLLATVPVGR